MIEKKIFGQMRNVLMIDRGHLMTNCASMVELVKTGASLLLNEESALLVAIKDALYAGQLDGMGEFKERIRQLVWQRIMRKQKHEALDVVMMLLDLLVDMENWELYELTRQAKKETKKDASEGQKGTGRDRRSGVQRRHVRRAASTKRG